MNRRYTQKRFLENVAPDVIAFFGSDKRAMDEAWKDWIYTQVDDGDLPEIAIEWSNPLGLQGPFDAFYLKQARKARA